METCPHAERLIPLLHDGELDSPIRREIRSHLATCVPCTRALSILEREQELLGQMIDEEIEVIDFSHFWQGVESRLHEPQPSWAVRLRLWIERWHLTRPLSAPAWAVAAVLLLTFGVLFQQKNVVPPDITQLLPPPQPRTVPGENPQGDSPSPQPPSVLDRSWDNNGPDNGFALVSNQAQIESLSSSDTVAVWNDPGNNSTVIWIGSDMNEGMP